MKKYLLMGILVAFNSVAFADGPLEDVMKQLSRDYVALKKSVSDPVLVKEMLAATVRSEENSFKAGQLLPEGLNSTASIVRYKELMGSLYQEFLNLELALLKGEQAEAQTVLNRIGDLRKVGHDEFK